MYLPDRRRDSKLNPPFLLPSPTKSPLNPLHCSIDTITEVGLQILFLLTFLLQASLDSKLSILNFVPFRRSTTFFPLLQVRAAANKDPGRLLLLHQRGTDREAGPRCPLRLHGPVHGRGHQVRATNDQQPRRHEGGNTHRGRARGRPRPEAVAIRRVQQGRRVGQQDGEQRNGGVRINFYSLYVRFDQLSIMDIIYLYVRTSGLLFQARERERERGKMESKIPGYRCGDTQNASLAT